MVEILVGHVWVEHNRTDVLSTAQLSASAILTDPGVKAVRIYEHEKRHKCTLVEELEGKVEFNVIPKMVTKNKQLTCPVCKAKNQEIQFDGTDEWLSCAECNRTIPV